MWFRPGEPREFRRDRFPVFIAETAAGHFYGMPMIDANGPKIARHYGAPELASPDAIVREFTADDEAPVRQFIAAHLPGADGPLTRSSVCTYTLTPDRHFILDRHPAHSQVAIAAGFSGHGFKFAPVVGEILADLATDGRTTHPIARFALGRFHSGV